MSTIQKDLILLTGDKNPNNNKTEFLKEIMQFYDDIDSDELSTQKIQLMKKFFNEFKDHVNDIKELDLDLKEYLSFSKNKNGVYQANNFHDKIKDIGDDSLIIYVKKAQLYKVYNSEGLEDFQNDESTHYRKSIYGPVYEVVRDTHPQKLMIVIKDHIRDDKLKSIKENINEFIKSIPEFSNSHNDLKVYANGDNTQFMISSIQLKNLQAKENFMDDFIRFMEKKGELDIAAKIISRPPPCDLKNARLYSIPSYEALIDGKPGNILDQLITTKTAPILIQNVQNTTYIITGNDNIINNGIIKNSSTTNIGKTKKTLESFCKFIYDSKPDWYLENQYVNIDIIVEAYRDYFDDTDTRKGDISKKIGNKIFSSSRRTGNITKKKLLSYTALKKSF